MSHNAKIRPLGLPVMLAVLALLCIAWGLNTLHLHRLERELSNLANEKLAEFRKDNAALGDISRMAADVVATKPFVFFGAPTGKISVFVEHEAPGKTSAIEGYEFFMTRTSDGVWAQTESGRCNSAQCTLDGKKLLDALNAKF